KIGEIINKAVGEYNEKTGKFVRDRKTLDEVLTAHGLDPQKLKDPWGRQYKVSYDVSGIYYVINFESYGEDGVRDGSYYNSDDFSAWKTYSNYFSKTESAINRILSENVNSGKRAFPASESEFTEMLREGGIPPEQIRDGYGRPAYVLFEKTSRYSDKKTVVNGKTTITPVTEEIALISIRSMGKDGVRGDANRFDDFDLAKFTSVVTERFKGMDRSRIVMNYVYFSGSKGAIRGTVLDMTGAVIPGADVLVSTSDRSVILKGKSDESGVFLIENVEPGNYSVEISAAGFRKAVYSNVRVSSQSLTQIEVTMDVGTVDAVVEVQAGSDLVDTTSSALLMTVGEGDGDGFGNGNGGGGGGRENQANLPISATPRLREYFPETLVWAPEIITDKNGKAELKFKMADSITTWKLYTVASTKNGKIGIAEKEIQAFQPFFADLDPPKFITQNDEIYLPSQIRNYTDSKQKVKVSMPKADWFTFLDTESRTSVNESKDQVHEIEVRSGSSENAVFGYRADKFVKDGKQRITAVGGKDSDAIEKPVTVRPDGLEVVTTSSKLFRQVEKFDVNFPANTIQNTQSANLKIYPNLLAHVAESVDGLLQRPYGCGEQTISSTYPNLMILKFSSEDNKLRGTARKYLQKGYERLLGYQIPGGGFSYWGGSDSADIALTAYALRFLKDAKAEIEVDQTIINSAESWLRSQQRGDGSWT
ncbi:MAG: alpha-2-macroglobulin family protein, partial [Pyrinomonadaceae bacterium]